MKKVLIVDDAAFMRITLKMMLEKNGYEILGEAGNGNIAFEKYKELRPDIVTMDITMPECSGIEALKKIREYDNCANVVMISAMGQESMVVESIVLGAKGFIIKPFNEAKILEVLSKA